MRHLGKMVPADGNSRTPHTSPRHREPGPADATFGLTRMPVGVSASLTVLMVALATELACIALIWQLNEALPAWGHVALGAGVVAAFLTATVATIQGFRMEQESPVQLAVESKGLRVLDGNGRSLAFLPHLRISSLELRDFPVAGLTVGAGSNRPLSMQLRLFDEPEDTLRLIGELRTRIGSLPGGASRLQALDRRNAAGARVASAPPGLSLGIVFALAVIAALQLGLGAMGGEVLMSLGANSGARMLEGEFWRPWTAGLLHLSILHITVNAFGLLLAGFLFERLLGAARFGLLIGLSSLAGCLLAAWAQPTEFGAGASAGFMGVIGAWMSLHLWRREQLPASLRLTVANLAALLMIIVAGDFMLPNMGHAAHLGGFLAGLALLPLLLGRVPLHELHRSTPVLIRVAALVLGATYVAALVSILVAAAKLA